MVFAGTQPSRQRVLNEVLDRIRVCSSDVQAPVVVFDIDSTLLETSSRHLEILGDFIARHPDPPLALLEAQERLTRNNVGWSLVSAVQARGVQDPSLLEALARFWRERFFSSRYMRFDQPTPGAPAFVSSCWARGALCYYLTARVAPETEEVTRDTLRRFGFPVSDHTRLHMKVHRDVTDLEHKTGAIQELSGFGTVVAAFENDPRHINLIHRAFPDAISVLLNTECHPDAPRPAPGIHRIANFLRQAG